MAGAGNPLQDIHGLWDIAYISLAIVTALLVIASLNMIALIWVEWATCHQDHLRRIVVVPTAVLACKPDLLALGQAFGLSAAAFSTALLALAAYMAATKRSAGFTTTTKFDPTPAASPDAPLPVSVIDMPAPSAPPIRAPKKRKGN